MNTSNNNNINILDLPDEILLIILNELDMVDVFYSFVNLNKRFDRLALDPFYVQHLDLRSKTLKNHNSAVDNPVFNQIYINILPQIHHNVNKLTVESLFMKFIFEAVDFSQLHSLSLVNCQSETLLQYLTSNIRFCRVLSNQITHLKVEIKGDIIVKLPDGIVSDLFSLILFLAKHLTDLTINQSLCDRNLMNSTFNGILMNHVSLTLTKLKINVNTFDDCLYILNGYLICLSTLIININRIGNPSLNINDIAQLSKLKCLSLISPASTCVYEKRVVPLLRQMLNLEELTLFLSVIRNNLPYIDGTHLYNDFLVYMSRLNKFTFSIYSLVHDNYDKIDLPSHDDIQNSFIKIGHQHIGSYVDVKLMTTRSRCHVYSLPYHFNNFFGLSNSYQGGDKFDKVRCWQLRLVHIDYVEQFLFETNTRLPQLKNLDIKYELLAIVTDNFTNNAARLNCSQLQNLIINEPFVRPENFHSYFPSL
ncbi:unnamed protein product [Rotaria sordida]|uniref:F-box domain-containing protein n=1 Tax=Rotaria sordida TaxID=392033 RepID=A0A819G3H2_9BILA|nr:unnamed protein product [Rotaria sordida]CAF3877934.1 unnamed protein product [Rotaria sordida]